MPPEILALMDRPLVLIAVLAVGAVLGIGVERLVEGQKRAERRACWQGRNTGKRGGKVVPLNKDGLSETAKSNGSATNQLACVMGAEFTARALLNRPEATLFKALDAAVIAHFANSNEPRAESAEAGESQGGLEGAVSANYTDA